MYDTINVLYTGYLEWPPSTRFLSLHHVPITPTITKKNTPFCSRLADMA